ncbi:C2 domain-containing protein [Hibiscus syriacus]|uniref:C2 domain-containing protein n=1 Tax=Hibiscus syriacus TaxID=106335 RepID=A0A6A2ZJU2_HIBSY|nr:C2 domain-containing protein [Hibiscus syriacus]
MKGALGIGVDSLVKPCFRKDMADLYGTDCIAKDSASDHTLVLGKKKVVVQHLYLGRNAPLITEIRVLHQWSDDDDVVRSMISAEDMSAVLAVKLRKRLGFEMGAKLNIIRMHVKAKVLIKYGNVMHKKEHKLTWFKECRTFFGSARFIWFEVCSAMAFLGHLRLCFVEPPYFQMTVKPIFTHGLDVTEVPGIDKWLDKLLSLAFEETLVEPNMLVVDFEKFSTSQPGKWFSVHEKQPPAQVKVEVIEAADMKPSDLNGLADPYVKGQVGSYRFKTKTHKKTLSPKWLDSKALSKEDTLKSLPAKASDKGSVSPKSDQSSSPDAKKTRVKHGLRKKRVVFNRRSKSDRRLGSLEEVFQSHDVNLRVVGDKEVLEKIFPDDHLPGHSTDKVLNEGNLSTAESGSKSPSKIRYMTGFLKRPEKSVRRIKCAFSIKGRKSRESSMANKDFAIIPESSADEYESSLGSRGDQKSPI